MSILDKLDVLAPLPEATARTFNLLPLLSLNRELDGDLNLGYFKGSASVNIGTPRKFIRKNKDHDISVVQDQRNPLSQTVIYKPAEEILQDFRSLKTVKHVHDEVMEMTSDVVPEVIMHNTLSLIPKPELEYDHPSLATSDAIGYYEKSSGVFYNMMKRRFGLTGTRNPTTIIKELCTSRRVWKPIMGTKIKSTQKLILPLGIEESGKHKGWMEFLDFMKPVENGKSIRIPPLISEMCDAFTKDRWWRDMGIPRRFLTLADGVTVDGVVYMLKKNMASIPA